MIIKNQTNLSDKDTMLLTKLCERIHYTHSNEPFSNHLHVVLKQAFPHIDFTFGRDDAKAATPENAHRDDLSAVIHLPVPDNRDDRVITQTESCQISTNRSASRPAVCAWEPRAAEAIRVPIDDDKLWVGLACSEDQTFSQNEIMLIKLLTPHMRIAWKNWKQIRKLETELQTLKEKNAAQEQSAKQTLPAKELMNKLTKRQHEIAVLVAQGMQNKQIAEVLHISPKTVGKHLENIFDVLKVNHRADLAAKCALAQSA